MENPHFHRNRLKIRMTAIILVVAVPILVAVAAFVNIRAANFIEEDLEAQLAATNRALSTNTSTWLDLNIRALQALSVMPQITSMDAVQQTVMLRQMGSIYEHMYLISTTDMNGMNVARSDDANLTDYSDRYWFQKARAGEDLSFQPLIGRTSGEPALVVSVPVERDETLVGVAMFASTLTDVGAEVQLSTVGDTGFSFIVDDLNRVIAHPDGELAAQFPDFTEHPAVRAMRRGETGQITFSQDDHEWSAFATTLDNGWGVITQQQRDELEEELTTLQTLSWGGIALGAILLSFGVWFIMERTLKPIENLTATATTIAEGDLSRRAAITTRDEIGLLAHTFNTMAAQLEALFGTLEQRVADRTRDLQAASDVSRQITSELDINAVLEQIVTLTAQRFDLYATIIFLADGQTLRWVAGANQAGELLAADTVQDIDLEARPSLIARAARERETIVLDDVSQSPDYMAVASLPDTRAEIVIPMQLKGELLGVVDIQASTVGRFSEDDVRVFTTLAEQASIAVRNAQLYSDAQKARQDAERANTVKSQFLAAMSHELRTPLNSILNFTQFISKGVLGPVNEKQIETLTRVVTAGKHLLSLINDVLDISKIEAGALELFIQEDVDLNRILDEATSTAHNLLGDKPVELVTEIETLPPIVGDERRVRQIVLNIISNACKFTREGRITVSAHQDNGEVRLAVQDTGPGIPLDQHVAVFDSFTQTETGIKHGGGTGLGMPISRKLAEAHGGRLWLESEPGKGSTFFVALPIRDAVLLQRSRKVK